MKDYIGKFVEIKNKVKLDLNNQISQVHNYPYKVINQNKKRTWICLESKVYCTYVSSITNMSISEVSDRSFWMKVNECRIVKF
jgi:hypothetical protein